MGAKWENGSWSRGGFALLWVAVMFLSGCGRGPKVTIPLQENAAKQYAYAINYREGSNLELINSSKRFLKTRAIVREHNVKVADFFPGDRKSTPLAKLEVIEMDGGLDFTRVKTTPKELRTAIIRLQALATDYPDYEYIQAKALFDQGMCYQRLHEFPQAQACYQKLRDKFTSSANTDIRELARMGSYLYNKTYTNE
jgi:hypothetical protein